MKVLEFRSHFSGNYGSGNWENTQRMVGAILFRSPVLDLSFEQFQEENWQSVACQFIGIAGGDGQIYLALLTKEEGKAGRGCDPYREEKWQIVPVEGTLAEALKSLAPKR